MPCSTKRHPNLALAAASLTLAIGSFAGCGSPMSASDDEQSDAFVPEDFVAENPADPSSAQDTTAQDTGQQNADEQAADATDTAADPANPESGSGNNGSAVSVNAMVGQVNGEAIYADQVFDINLIAQLESFGRRYTNEQFRSQARPVIEQKLMSVVMDRLIFGVAERNIEERDRRAIDYGLQAEREELLRYYGRGSQALANAEFLQDRGKTIDQHLRDLREQMTISFYLREEIVPRISVTQDQVERFYQANILRFQQPDRRVIRIIRIDNETDPDAAQAVQDRLARGEAFESIASDPEVNPYNPNNAGVFYGGELYPGDFAIDPVNDALQRLDEGEHAGPISHGRHIYFIQVVELERGASISLNEAQVAIERELFNDQRRTLLERFRMEQFQDGNYTDLQQMSRTLIEIASTRYDQ